MGWGGGMSKFFAGVGKTLMFDYLTKTSIFILKDFTINSINCIVWQSNVSIRT